jgi:hypothetical protein
MRAAVNSFLLVGLSLFLPTTSLVAPAAAQDASAGSVQEGADRFVPSLHVISGLVVHEWEASVDSEICRDCVFPSPAAQALRPFEEGETRDVTPYMGAGLELMTPELPFAGLRFFAGGDWAAAFGTERKVAREGDPSVIGDPAPGGSSNLQFREENAIGQGSVLLAEVDHFTYAAHAGISVPFSWRGRAFRLKPSFAWMRWEIETEGRVADAECFQPAFGASQCNPNASPNGFLRPVQMLADASETFDAFGPGLDLEMDTGRFGPLGTSLFVSTRAYRIQGDRKVEFRAPVQSYSDSAGNDQTRASFSFEVDPWVYRAGVGIRFQWLGSYE